MTAEEITPESSLADFLRARALRTPPSRLGIDFIGGALIAGAALWARPVGWAVLASAGCCLCLYGLWALAERHLQAASRDTLAIVEFGWLAARISSAVAGLAALFALLFSLLALALGTWIS